MSKIAFIAPDKKLFLQGKKIIKELGLAEKVEVYLARLKRAVRLAHHLQHEDIDVIVSRGGTAQLIIESGIRVPVVEIAITGQDLAQAFHDAKQLSKKRNPRVAILAFQNMIYDIEVLSEILGIQLSIFPLEKTEDIPASLDQLTPSEVDVVVGGMKTVILCEKKGFQALRITSGNFAIRAAFLEAQKILLARVIEKERAQEFKALVDYSIQGIISINRHKLIQVFNPAAERLLQLSSKKMIGQPVQHVLPHINVDDCLTKGQDSYGQITQVGSSWIAFNIAPINVQDVIVGAILTFQDITRIQEEDARIRNEVMAKKFIAKYQASDIKGISPHIMETKRMAEEIARVDSTVLISGESGTGKELFAQSIHNQSQRKNGPFIAVNCAALPPNLLESELFGYVEGAFTGATKKGKAGLFELAHRGTIFLDEISEMDRYAQGRLLRILQEKQVMRLGDDKYTPIDVRIIAATNKNLVQLIKEGHFRQDLYYRLKVLTLNIPPLRKRKEDIRYLAEHFLDYNSKLYNKRIELSESAFTLINESVWPGNVRELMHFFERLVITAKEKRVTEAVIQLYLDDYECEEEIPIESEEKRILSALAKCDSNITKTAKLLGMDRSTLYRKLRYYQIEVKKTY